MGFVGWLWIVDGDATAFALLIPCIHHHCCSLLGSRLPLLSD
jgi:hypothetical protein